MGALIGISINLDKLDKSKIIEGKKGKYYSLTLSLNDDPNDFGKNVSAYDSQSKEEREAKQDKNYLGGGKVFWTDGVINAVSGNSKSPQEKKNEEEVMKAMQEEDDLPF